MLKFSRNIAWLWGVFAIISKLNLTASRNLKPEPTTNKPEPDSRKKNALPEPVPDWPDAFNTWKWAWPLHVYLFGILYILVAMASLVSLTIEFLVRRSTFSRLKVSFFSQLAIFGISRAILLFIDPYISKRLSNGLPTYVVWSLGLPIIFSVFSILLLVLADTTRVYLAPPRFQNLMIVSIISVTNVSLVFIVDIIVIRFFNSGILVFICQLYTALFGLFLSLGFLYVARKLSRNITTLPILRLRRLQCFVYLSAAIGITLVCSEVYSAIEVFGVLNDSRQIPPWPWLALQTFARMIEIAMCAIVMIVFKRTKISVGTTSESRTDQLP